MTKQLLSVFLFVFVFVFVPKSWADEIDDWNPTYTVDFFAAFDKTGAEWAEKNFGSLEAYGEKVVHKINTVMKNSNLDGKYRLVGTYCTGEVVKEVVQGPSYAYNHPGLRKAVREVQADLTLLFITAEGSTRPESGNAPYLARPGDAFGCAIASNGVYGLTAAHECGHMMGCSHARDVDVFNEHPYDAGAMRWIEGRQYSTVMGYHGELLPFFSSPDHYYLGVAMGSESENCCRRITEQLPNVVRLGDILETFELGLTEWVPDYTMQSVEVSLRNQNKAYKIKSDADWLSPSITQGYRDDPFRIEVKANNSGKVRTGHIIVSDWDADNPDYGQYGRDDLLQPATITVHQLPVNGMLVMPEEMTMPYYGAEQPLKIYTRSSFIVEDDMPEWLSLSKMYGEGNTTLTLTAAENTDAQSRTATITIRHDGTFEKYEVKQQGYNDVTTCIGCLINENPATGHSYDPESRSAAFDLQGRSYVGQPKSKGIYIQGGRKVVMKVK